MADPQIIQVSVASGPAVVSVRVPTGPEVIRVNVPGLQGPPGEDGAPGEGSSGVGAPDVIDETGESSVTVTAGDNSQHILLGTGAVAVALPAASTWDPGLSLLIVDHALDADSNTKTITPDGSETIRGLSSYTIQFRGGTVELWPSPDDGGWYARES